MAAALFGLCGESRITCAHYVDLHWHFRATEYSVHVQRLERCNRRTRNPWVHECSSLNLAAKPIWLKKEVLGKEYYTQADTPYPVQTVL